MVGFGVGVGAQLLAAGGHGVRLEKWDEVFAKAANGPQEKVGMTVKLTGANYVRPREGGRVKSRKQKAKIIDGVGLVGGEKILLGALSMPSGARDAHWAWHTRRW